MHNRIDGPLWVIQCVGVPPVGPLPVTRRLSGGPGCGREGPGCGREVGRRHRYTPSKVDIVVLIVGLPHRPTTGPPCPDCPLPVPSRCPARCLRMSYPLLVPCLRPCGPLPVPGTVPEGALGGQSGHADIEVQVSDVRGPLGLAAGGQGGKRQAASL